jgi:hypothetical protein
MTYGLARSDIHVCVCVCVIMNHLSVRPNLFLPYGAS